MCTPAVLSLHTVQLLRRFCAGKKWVATMNTNPNKKRIGVHSGLWYRVVGVTAFVGLLWACEEVSLARLLSFDLLVGIGGSHMHTAVLAQFPAEVSAMAAPGLDVAAPPGGVKHSGGYYRRQRLALPQTFVVYTWISKSSTPVKVWGLCEFVCVGTLDADDVDDERVAAQRHSLGLGRLSTTQIVAWRPSRLVPLAEPLFLQSNCSKSWKQIATFVLCPEVLSMQQRLDVASLPRGFRVEEAFAESLVRGRLDILLTSRTHCTMAGLPAPTAALRLQPQSIALPLSSASCPRAPLATSSRSGSAQLCAASSTSLVVRPVPPHNDAASALALNVTSYGSSAMSAVAYTFKPESLMTAWALHVRLLGSVTSLEEVIKLSLKLTLSPEQSESMCRALDAGDVRVPSLRVVRRVGFKLNILDMLFQRHLALSTAYFRWVYLDSSPQGGYNWLVFMEDRVGWERSLGSEQRQQLDLKQALVLCGATCAEEHTKCFRAPCHIVPRICTRSECRSCSAGGCAPLVRRLDSPRALSSGVVALRLGGMTRIIE